MPEHNHPPMMRTSGLQPGCPRCEQHADDPRSIDRDNLRRIWYGFYHQPGWRNELNVKVVNVLERAFTLTANLGLHDGHSFHPPHLDPFTEGHE